MAGGFGNVILGMQSLRCDTKYCAANEQPHPAFTQARRQLILSIAWSRDIQESSLCEMQNYEMVDSSRNIQQAPARDGFGLSHKSPASYNLP